MPFAVLVSLPLLVMSILIGIGEGAVHWYEDLCDGFNIVLKDDLT